MPIKSEGKDISAIHAFGKVITTIYAAGKIVWNAVRSCFGAGYWIDAHPWSDTDPWKANQ